MWGAKGLRRVFRVAVFGRWLHCDLKEQQFLPSAR